MFLYFTAAGLISGFIWYLGNPPERTGFHLVLTGISWVATFDALAAAILYVTGLTNHPWW
jgi:hypothetical protein